MFCAQPIESIRQNLEVKLEINKILELNSQLRSEVEPKRTVKSHSLPIRTRKETHSNNTTNCHQQRLLVAAGGVKRLWDRRSLFTYFSMNFQCFWLDLLQPVSWHSNVLTAASTCWWHKTYERNAIFHVFIIYPGNRIVHKCTLYSRFCYYYEIHTENSKQTHSYHFDDAQCGHFSRGCHPPMGQRSQRNYSTNIRKTNLPLRIGFPGSASEISKGKKEPGQKKMPQHGIDCIAECRHTHLANIFERSIGQKFRDQKI